MNATPSDETTVIQTYAHRSEAEIAKSYLQDNGIESFVAADDVHVPLQMTEGARLFAMESDSARAIDLLSNAGLDAQGFIPRDTAEDVEDEDSYAEDSENVRPVGKRRTRNSYVVATTVVALMIVLMFFVPWRLESSGEILWAPFYRTPISHSTTFQELGSVRADYEEGRVAVGILIFQLVAVGSAGWVADVVTSAIRAENDSELEKDPT